MNLSTSENEISQRPPPSSTGEERGQRFFVYVRNSNK
jgi:hypothetical protein